MSTPSGMSALKGLLLQASAEDRLNALLGREPAEVCSWNRDGTTFDGLPMEECRDLVCARAFELLGLQSLAMTVAEYISVIVPLAKDIDEIDEAIGEIGPWILTLVENGISDEIVHVMRKAAEVDLLEIDRETLESEDSKEAYDLAMEHYLEFAQQGTCKFTLGGRAAMLAIDADATVVLIEIEDHGWAIVCEIAHQGSGDGGGWNDGEDEPEPEPNAGPSHPVLQDA